jgi:LacI family transcriptional regulator
MKKRVTIADVAELANVSITTVSRVINDVGYPVSPQKRNRIFAAVKQLNYTPNSSAQRLRSDFNPIIGLIVRDLSDSYFSEIAKGATEQAMELGHLAFVCNTGRNPSNEMEFHELLWKNRVRGILLIGGGIDTPEYRAMIAKQVERITRFGLRMVANAPQDIALPIVTIDQAAISSQITEHFLKLGHRSIGLITGEPWVITSKLHRQGYVAAMTAHGLPMHPELVKQEAFTERCGYNNCQELLHHPRPTAIYCGSDPIAVGVLDALHDAGLDVPRDVSLISIGDTSIAVHLRPALTCVRLPRYQMGARAVELILSEQFPETHTEYLPAKFIERESVRQLD